MSTARVGNMFCNKTKEKPSFTWSVQGGSRISHASLGSYIEMLKYRNVKRNSNYFSLNNISERGRMTWKG